MSRNGTRGLLAAAATSVLAIGLTPSAASAAPLKVEICLNSGFCMQIINVDLPSTPIPGDATVSGSVAGLSVETDLALQ